MKKLNNRGFLLSETLIATCIIAVLATSLYVYVSKIISNYEKRDNYDNVVDVYKLSTFAFECESNSTLCRKNTLKTMSDDCLPCSSNGAGGGGGYCGSAYVSNNITNISNKLHITDYAYICKGNFKENLINRIENSADNDNEYKEYVRLLSIKDLEADEYMIVTKFKNSQGRKKSFASLIIK